jgi:hypothetical protein
MVEKTRKKSQITNSKKIKDIPTKSTSKSNEFDFKYYAKDFTF